MGSDDDAWFEDYDTDMSNGSGSGGYPSDSDGGHAGSSSSDDDGDDGFERTQPGALVQSRSRLYTIIDRPSLRRLQVQGGRGVRRGAARAPASGVGGCCRVACLSTRRRLAPCPQEEALHQVQGIMGCSATVARTLLTYFNWDAEAVLGGLCGCQGGGTGDGSAVPGASAGSAAPGGMDAAWLRRRRAVSGSPVAAGKLERPGESEG